jgi:hypothetical protein
MLPKNRLKFLRKPVYSIPCHEINCKIILYSRSCRKKYCHIHKSLGILNKKFRKNVKKFQKSTKSYNTTERKCLKCGESFGSISKFNKLCDLCNYDNDKIVLSELNNMDNSSLTRHGNIHLGD